MLAPAKDMQNAPRSALRVSFWPALKLISGGLLFALNEDSLPMDGLSAWLF
jgi:hypothetical protein